MTTEPFLLRRKPRFLVCEDGDEYLERFNRFLGQAFEFIQSRDLETLLEHLERRQPVAGVLLDLDFRRIASSKLVDEAGLHVTSATQEQLARVASIQGIAILGALRKRGIQTNVLLFADIDDNSQRDYLERTFAPMELIASHIGLRELKRRLEELGQ